MPGVVWRISEASLTNLDRYEGYPDLYRRAECPVELTTGQPVMAWVYFMPQQIDRPPAPEYLQVLRAGYREWDLPEAHLDAALGD